MDSINFIIEYWFSHSSKWFIQDNRFENELKINFLSDYEQAKNGELEGWKETPKGCLALIILLDQIPRAIYRGQRQAFETDYLAQELSIYAIDMGFIRQLELIQRMFILMPLMHSENINMQNTCVMYFKKLYDESVNSKWSEQIEKLYNAAQKSRDLIEKFGKFPQRDKIIN